MVKRYHHKTKSVQFVEYEAVPNGIFVNYDDYAVLEAKILWLEGNLEATCELAAAAMADKAALEARNSELEKELAIEKSVKNINRIANDSARGRIDALEAALDKATSYIMLDSEYPSEVHDWIALIGSTSVPDPLCHTPGCKNFVESSEDYCTDCLDSQSKTKA